MTMFPDQSRTTRPLELSYGTDNKAVFNFFNAVYAWMAVGLALTAAVAWYVSQNQTMLRAIYGNGRGMIVGLLLGAFALSWYVQSQAARLRTGVATALFLVYATLIGAMISGIFIVYQMQTILAAFLLTGGTFGAMSVYGFVTKRDLTSIGSFLVMAALGLFIASIVNVFIANNAFSWVITYAVLAVFIGLTAYETQKLKRFAVEYGDNASLASRYAIVGSLVLYISFINLFLSILRILGNRR
jgi:FtsH-binding integral membrane protein